MSRFPITLGIAIMIVGMTAPMPSINAADLDTARGS